MKASTRTNGSAKASAEGTDDLTRDSRMSWLARCVGEADDFLATSWSVAPVIHRGSSGIYDDIFNLDALNDLISMGVEAAHIRMMKNGRIAPPKFYTRESQSGARGSAPVADPQRIRELVRSGFTLNIMRMEYLVGGLYRVTRKVVLAGQWLGRVSRLCSAGLSA